MNSWLRGLRGGLLGFLIIAALVVGGLGWATVSALRLEKAQIENQLRAKQEEKLRIALWQLDGRISPVLAREESRPYYAYSALFAPTLSLRNDGKAHQAGTVLHISPLIRDSIPDWMLLHFQVDEEEGWTSPQVPPASITDRLKKSLKRPPFRNITERRKKLLRDLRSRLPAIKLLATAREEKGDLFFEDHGLGVIACGTSQMGENVPVQQQTLSPGARNRVSMMRKVSSDVQQKAMRQGRALVYRNILGNGIDWLTPRLQQWKVNPPIVISLTSMVPVWLRTDGKHEDLLLLRLVEVEGEQLCQGVVLNAVALEKMLLGEIQELLPNASLTRVYKKVPHPERTMATLPFQLDPGPLPQAASTGWTPLRIGLLLAWVAALVALLAVGLGGWSLLDLSERRFRFVSAVTHELRTPLTTLRLYLDMLLSDMIKEPEKRQSYLETLSGETERLHRLVTNVLAFSRLEKQTPRIVKREVPADELIRGVQSTWEERATEAGKTFVVDNQLPPLQKVETDAELTRQILDNLIDNACKYSAEAEDPCLTLRSWADSTQIVFEVEDCGPGIPANLRRTIFRAFRRGEHSEVLSGVGLGLALAERWARLLGGSLTLQSGRDQKGACFRLRLPLQ